MPINLVHRNRPSCQSDGKFSGITMFLSATGTVRAVWPEILVSPRALGTRHQYKWRRNIVQDSVSTHCTIHIWVHKGNDQFLTMRFSRTLYMWYASLLHDGRPTTRSALPQHSTFDDLGQKIKVKVKEMWNRFNWFFNIFYPPIWLKFCMVVNNVDQILTIIIITFDIRGN